MRELIWGITALVILLLMTLIVMGLRTVPGNKMSLGVSNLFEDGLLFGLFTIVFAPLYLAWMGTQPMRMRLWPPAPLPVDGDDPVWGRNINRKVTQEIFLAVQQARMKHNLSRVKRLMGSDLYKRLSRESEHAPANHEMKPETTFEIKSITISDERIDQRYDFCYFSARVTGTKLSAGETEDFAAQLEFIRAPVRIADARWELNEISGL